MDSFSYDFCLLLHPQNDNHTDDEYGQCNEQKTVINSCKETESKVLPNLNVEENNDPHLHNASLGMKHFIATNLDHHNRGREQCNNDAQKTIHDPVIQLDFSNLPNDKFITIKKSKPIRNVALFISFNYNLTNHISNEECNAHGFQALFHDFQDHINITPIVRLVNDVAVNCWAYDYNVNVFLASKPIFPICIVTALLKRLRTLFDQKTLDIIIIWLNVYERSRSRIDDECKAAKATACIQGVEISDVIPQIMSYFDKSNDNGEIHKKPPICYHEFNLSYSAAMKIDDKIWLNAKQYYKVAKSQMELGDLNPDNEIVLKSITKHDNSESILRKVLCNKFSQHIRLKHLLFSTRVSPIYFTQEKCRCNLNGDEYSSSKSIVNDDDDQEILKKSFIDILEEVRHNLIQDERKRILTDYSDFVDGRKNLFLN
ncbi:13422_t:CDS:2 [Funneliformis caledonium]|uniref:13422_t:CDS:1 n=1 Tax=Funneliformis caledonium TaxID=1117310 RepID=A0A9N9APB8_9GLOM|nr:13422_t:CDS:2 [Funneliformis caledonium]